MATIVPLYEGDAETIRREGFGLFIDANPVIYDVKWLAIFLRQTQPNHEFERTAQSLRVPMRYFGRTPASAASSSRRRSTQRCADVGGRIVKFSRTHALVMIAVLSFASPSFGQSPQDYCPLAEGRRWTYQAQVGGERATLEITNLSAREGAGRQLTPQKTDSNIAGESFSFLGSDGDGVYELARQPPGFDAPALLPEPRYIVKVPIELGASWKDIGGRSVVVAVDETVAVPAGTFHGCLKIRSEGEVKSDSWYAPGVGLVKAAPIPSEPQDGNFSLELVSYTE